MNGRKFASELKLYSDYLKYKEDEQRYETWEEAVDDVLNTHILKYGEKVRPLIESVRPNYVNKEILASQRNLQFRGEQILRHNPKIFNCCVSYAFSPDVFDKGFYVLLCGTGLGINLSTKYVKHLPKLNRRNKGTKTFIIPDSIEGWQEASKVLISSFCTHPSLLDEYFGFNIRFDYSLIRPKGAYITGGFKAPSHVGLKQSLEKIEQLIYRHLGDNDSIEFKSIIAYDIFMHLSDAVLSGGLRRSAMNIVMSPDDEEMVNAKIGNWRKEHPHRARSNNSVGLMKHQFTSGEFKELVSKNHGDNDLGFVLLEHEDEMFNPCFEIGFNYFNELPDLNEAVFCFCNLTEINASSCKFKTSDNFSEQKFYELCESASILGTLQAGYTEFPFLGKRTEEIVKGEALLGVSITGWMTRPELFNPEILKKGAEIVKETNKRVAEIIGINQSARTTTVKPSGNASVVLGTASGIHPEHSKRYFRIMQLNKESETAKWLEKNAPELLEESVWSNTKSDYVVFIPHENLDGTMYKDDMTGVKHLKLIELVQKHWVGNGKNEERCYLPTTKHNVSNTVIIDDIDEIVDYVYEHQDNFTAISFISNFGDKDFNQAPFTSVLNTEELIKRYGDASIFASGLIVDGLHYFGSDLWKALEHVSNPSYEIEGDRSQVLLKKDWIRRVKKFSKNFLNGDITETIYCLKDVHLWHKWKKIERSFKIPDFTKILKEPNYTDIDTMGAQACSGGQCEIPDWAL